MTSSFPAWCADLGWHLGTPIHPEREGALDVANVVVDGTLVTLLPIENEDRMLCRAVCGEAAPNDTQLLEQMLECNSHLLLRRGSALCFDETLQAVVLQWRQATRGGAAHAAMSMREHALAARHWREGLRDGLVVSAALQPEAPPVDFFNEDSDWARRAERACLRRGLALRDVTVLASPSGCRVVGQAADVHFTAHCFPHGRCRMVVFVRLASPSASRHLSVNRAAAINTAATAHAEQFSMCRDPADGVLQLALALPLREKTPDDLVDVLRLLQQLADGLGRELDASPLAQVASAFDHPLA